MYPEILKKNRNLIKIYFKKYWKGYVLFLPSVAIILLFKGYPLLRGFFLSFTRPISILKNSYAGLENYKNMLVDNIFLISLINIFKSVSVLPIFISVPFLIAFLLHQRITGWKIFRATYLFSYLLSPVMVGYIFTFFFSTTGILNNFFELIGLKGLSFEWLANAHSAMWVVLFVVLWSWSGLGTIIYLAAMSSIDEDLYESARLEGANLFHLIIYITIPQMLPTISYWGVICTTGLLLWLFPFLFSLTEGGPGYASMTPEYYIYLTATRFIDPGYSSALGIFLFIIIALVSFFQIKMMFKK